MGRELHSNSIFETMLLSAFLWDLKDFSERMFVQHVIEMQDSRPSRDKICEYGTRETIPNSCVSDDSQFIGQPSLLKIDRMVCLIQDPVPHLDYMGRESKGGPQLKRSPLPPSLANFLIL